MTLLSLLGSSLVWSWTPLHQQNIPVPQFPQTHQDVGGSLSDEGMRLVLGDHGLHQGHPVTDALWGHSSCWEPSWPSHPSQSCSPGGALTSTKKDLSWSRFSKTLGERVSSWASLRAALSADSRAGWGSWGAEHPSEWGNPKRGWFGGVGEV